MIKVVIFIGGPQKGTRFRPLSLELPKPLFPIAGVPLIHHHLESCAKVKDVGEIILIGFYQTNDMLTKFLKSAQLEFDIPVRYLQEYQPLGTAGGLYHFRDQILLGNPECIIVLNSDHCCDLPLNEFLQFHHSHPGKHSILATEANKNIAKHFGCLVEDEITHEVLHYAEKPETFVSEVINCGVYIFSPDIMDLFREVIQRNFQQATNIMKERLAGQDMPMHDGGIWPRFTQDYVYKTFNVAEIVWMGEDLLSQLAGTGNLYVYKMDRFWTVFKSANAAIYSNRFHLSRYHTDHPSWLAVNGPDSPKIIGDVYIHPTAVVHTTAVLGPNVSVGPGVVVGAGARIRESIILDGADIKDHCCILYSIIGWNCSIGKWARVEGSRCDPNPNDPHAQLLGESLFNDDGRLTPSITVLGRNCTIPPEVVVLNSIVLPYKDLSSSYKNEIIL